MNLLKIIIDNTLRELIYFDNIIKNALFFENNTSSKVFRKMPKNRQ